MASGGPATPAGLSLSLFLFESIDQLDGGEEAVRFL